MSASTSQASPQLEFKAQGRGKKNEGNAPKKEGQQHQQRSGNRQQNNKPRGDGNGPRKPREPRAESSEGNGAANNGPQASANANASATAHPNGAQRPKGQQNGERKAKNPNANANGRAQKAQGKDKEKDISSDPKFAALKQATNGYFDDAVLTNTLKEANMDVDAALASLNAKKQNSWSSVVAKTQSKPFARVEVPTAKDSVAPVAAPAASSSTPKATQKEKPAAVPAPAAPAPPPVDPEKHIEALAKEIDENVRESETRAQQLKNIQLEIQSISAPRDSKIEQLAQDKTNLLARQQQIREELVKIDSKLKEIDLEVDQIKKDKIEKISVLEQKSKALLSENRRK